MSARHLLIAAAACCALVPALAQDSAPSETQTLRATGAYPTRQATSQWLGSNLIGAKVVSHGRYIAFQMAEVAIPRDLFADILRLIAELRSPPDPAPA